MAPPIRTRAVSPTVNLSYLEASISLLSLSIRGQKEWNPQSQKTNQMITWTAALSNSMKLWTMSCRVTLLKNVVHWEGNDKLLQYSCFENPMNSMKRKKIWHWNELPRSEGAYYATGEECRNSSRKSEETVPKWKQCRVVDVTGDGSKVQCCKDQHCIQIWNVRSMNQGKLQVVKEGDGKNKYQHFRNQWTKMNWNGQI